MTHWIKNRGATKGMWIFFCVVFWVDATYAQTEKQVQFVYTEQRTGKQQSASYFLDDFALRGNVPGLDCYFAMGYYRFHVAGTGKIDSVAFKGDIAEELRKLGKNKILESQPYWVCKDCQKNAGHWFTLPVYVAYTTKSPCPDDPVYKQSLLFWYDLFKDNKDEQLQVSPNEWLLAPIYAIKMR